MSITVKENILKQAAERSIDDFLEVIVNAIYESVNFRLDATSMQTLNADQITLLAYKIMQTEVMDGGFIQLIHNGYGGFIFHNPFAKMMRLWNIPELATLVNKAHKAYNKFHLEIERDCTDDEFMAMFENYPVFDDLDDNFVENEEIWTSQVAYYVDEHLTAFVKIETDE